MDHVKTIAISNLKIILSSITTDIPNLIETYNLFTYA